MAVLEHSLHQPETGADYIPAREAGQHFGYTGDYVARLAREGRVRGRRIGHQWFVDRQSFGQFMAAATEQKALRCDAHKETRKIERKERRIISQNGVSLTERAAFASLSLARADSWQSRLRALLAALGAVAAGGAIGFLLYAQPSDAPNRLLAQSRALARAMSAESVFGGLQALALGGYEDARALGREVEERAVGLARIAGAVARGQYAQAPRGFWGSIWCDTTALFWFPCEHDTVLVADVPPPTEEAAAEAEPLPPPPARSPLLVSPQGGTRPPLGATRALSGTERAEGSADLATGTPYITMRDLATGLVVLQRETADALSEVRENIKRRIEDRIGTRAIRSVDETADNIFDSINNVSRSTLALSGGTLTGALTGTIGTFDTLTTGTLTVSGTGASSIAGNVSFDTDTLFVDAANNRVGIGTTTPGTILSVQGVGNFAGTSSMLYSTLALPSFSATSTSATSTLAAGGFTVGTNQFLVQQTSGRIGVGTTSPGATVDIVQNANGATVLRARRATDTVPTGDFINLTTADGATMLFRVDNSGNLSAGGIINTGSQTITSVSTPQFRVQYDASNEWTASTDVNGVTTYRFIGTTPLARWTPASNSVNTFSFTNAAGSSLLSLDTTNSRVGVSSTTPWGALSVNPNGATGPEFVVGSSTATHLILTNAGFFGIGTTSPQGLLTVEQGTEASSLWVGNSGSSTPSLVVRGVNGNGNVGIGTTSPQTLLAIGNGAASGGVYITSAGNLGIGTTSPNAALSVVGNITSPGAGAGSEKFGLGATAAGTQATAFGAAASADAASAGAWSGSTRMPY